jgi:hypothetical protein
LSITVSLASHVLSLSTDVLADQSVSPNAAFFGEWRFSRRTLLFVLLSSVCLRSSSQSLNRYVFFPNNYIHLASFRRPHSVASVVLSIFHNAPGQSFAFVNTKQGSNLQSIPFNGIGLPLAYLRTHQEVLPQLLHALLDAKYNTPTVFCLAGYSTTLYKSGA